VSVAVAPENPYRVEPAVIVDKVREVAGIYTFVLRLADPAARRRFRFSAGQFNMIAALGVGEVPISIVSDPDEPEVLHHTIRVVGRVTGVMATLGPGDVMGVRGPYGRGWPLDEARGQDLMIVTGGLGCAPVAGAIEYVVRRRRAYGAMKILHGVKTPRDLLYRERFAAWRRLPDTEVLLASDQPGRTWRNHVGVVTDLFEEVALDPDRTTVLMCGPEVMMRVGAGILARRGIPPGRVHVSLERNMQCGIGLCGHCQLGPFFVCKDGPVMSYAAVAGFLGRPGI
jgi:sulfhydrogenase subunit gamma (sulfur reductase)